MPDQLGQAVAPVHPAARDHEPVVVAGGAARIVQHRVGPVGEAGGRAADARGGDAPLAPFPPVVAALLHDVHFLARALAHVAHVELAGDLVEEEAEGIAEAGRVDLGAHAAGGDSGAVELGGPDKRVVGRDGVVGGSHDGRMVVGGQAARLFVHVDAEDGGEEILVDALAVAAVAVVVAAALVARADVQVAIRTEGEVARVVVGAVVGLADEGDLGGGAAEVRVGGRHLVAGGAVGEAAGVGVIDKQVTVAGVVGVKGQPEQSAFAARIHARGDVQEGRAGGCGQVGDDHDVARPLHHKEPVGLPGRRGGGHGIGEHEAGEGGLRGVAVGGGRRQFRRQGQGGVGHALGEPGVGARRAGQGEPGGQQYS